MPDFFNKGVRFLLPTLIKSFVGASYGDISNSKTIYSSKVDIYYLPDNENTLLFTIGLSSFKQSGARGYPQPFGLELFGHLPKGLSFEQVLDSSEFSLMKEMVNKVYTSLDKGENVFPDTIIESDGVFLPQFDSVVLLDDSINFGNYIPILKRVVFLSIVPLYNEETEYFSTHALSVDIGATFYKRKVDLMLDGSRKKMKFKSGKSDKVYESQALDIFGEAIAGNARDVAIQDTRLKQSKKKTIADVELNKELKKLSPDQLSFVNDSVPQIVDTTFHYFLQMLNQDEDIEVVIYVNDDIDINIKDVCSDFSEEMFSKGGWVERFSENKL